MDPSPAAASRARPVILRDSPRLARLRGERARRLAPRGRRQQRRRAGRGVRARAPPSPRKSPRPRRAPARRGSATRVASSGSREGRGASRARARPRAKRASRRARRSASAESARARRASARATSANAEATTASATSVSHLAVSGATASPTTRAAISEKAYAPSAADATCDASRVHISACATPARPVWGGTPRRHGAYARHPESSRTSTTLCLTPGRVLCLSLTLHQSHVSGNTLFRTVYPLK